MTGARDGDEPVRTPFGRLHAATITRSESNRSVALKGFAERQASVGPEMVKQVKTRDLDDVDRLAAALNEQAPSAGAAAIVNGRLRIDNACGSGAS